MTVDEQWRVYVNPDWLAATPVPEVGHELAHLAWHGLVDVAERQLPILVLDDMSHITGAIQIKNYLSGLTASA